MQSDILSLAILLTEILIFFLFGAIPLLAIRMGYVNLTLIVAPNDWLHYTALLQFRTKFICVAQHCHLYVLSIRVNGIVVQYASHFRWNLGLDRDQLAWKLDFENGTSIHSLIQVDTQQKHMAPKILEFTTQSPVAFSICWSYVKRKKTKNPFALWNVQRVSVNTACFFYIELFIEHYAFTMNSRCKFFILFHFKLKGNKEKEKIGLLSCIPSLVCTTCIQKRHSIRYNGWLSI